MTKKSAFIIGIVGATGSGKSMFSKMLSDHFEGKVVHISSDMYYKDQSTKPLAKRILSNMDRPQAVDFSLLIKHLKNLIKGRCIEQPIFDFATHTRKKRKIIVEPKSVIIIEGLLLLADKKLRDFFDLKIYIEVDDDLRLARRIKRDVEEKRSKSLEMAIAQYLVSARPMHKLFVEPQKDLANIIVPWNKMDQEAVDTISARIREMLRIKGYINNHNNMKC
ncbi:MAG: uridine kinase [Gammaproteobacteria bacterium]|nr:uridine kinase [Gammaproteobacteria bacterium]